MIDGAAIGQLGIALFGVPAIWLSQDPRESHRRWACIFGMSGQPFWLYSALIAHQWGIVFLTTLYTASWLKGVYVHWAKPRHHAGGWA